MIRIEHLKKEYPNVTPIKDLSVEIHDGDVISIIGPSGTGKSTLLRCLNLLEKPTSGRIFVGDEEITSPKCNIPQLRQRMGMVFQSFNLFRHLTVIENIMFSPVNLLHKSRQEAYDEGMQLLHTVGLSEKALSYPEELSGGQKQRIAIARTLAMNPDILLFDEPTSALDPNMVGEVEAVIRTLSKSGKTMLIVTHEMKFARSICNRVFYMDEGGIYEDGSPEQIFDHSLREKTRWFVQHLKVLELTIDSPDYDFLEKSAAIRYYCEKNQIPSRMARKLELLFEEQVHSLLVLSHMKLPLSLQVEYSEETQVVEMRVRYQGDAVQLLPEDQISMDILKGVTREIVHTTFEDQEWKNQIILKL